VGHIDQEQGNRAAMRKNTVKSMMKVDQAAVSAWLTMNSAFAAEIVAHCGFDCVTVDMQHGMIDFGDAIHILQAISTSNAIPFARPTGSGAVEIMQLLDAGAYGIIALQIPARGQALVRPAPRRDLRRRRLRAARQRRDLRFRDDRIEGGR
jgi:4-hydroxy-2-oxoheptanedioate aldolase